MGGATGLNYQSLEVLFRIYKVKDRRQMLEDIQAIEIGALTELSAQKKDS